MTDAERELRELLDTIPHEYVYGGAFAHAMHHSQDCFHCKLETMLPRIESLILAERQHVRQQCVDAIRALADRSANE